MKRREAGITLVEVVIAVGIVLILAAIVAPNFQHACTRSKSARVQSDERSLATAIEAYAVDCKTYPPSAYPTNHASGGQMTFRSYALLTTPVAYITAIPSDVYAPMPVLEVSNGWEKGRKNPCIFYSGYVPPENAPTQDSRGRRNFWVLVSVGPAMMNLVSVDGSDPVSDPDPARTPYSLDPGDKAVMLKGGTTVRAPTSVGAADGGAWTDVMYDPSNGTNSRGNIVKSDGDGALPRFVSR